MISCEFFPPRTDEGFAKLKIVRDRLLVLKPAYFSVTFGAGGSTQEKTLETVLEIKQNTEIPPAPHLSCIGSTREHIRALLQTYLNHGVRRIVALRGDRPSGMMGAIGEFNYASELVEFIRAETGDAFHIEVAAYPEHHPESSTADSDFTYFARKVAAGANGAITQYFYNADAYFRFVEECTRRGVTIPIYAGIMPISNFAQLSRFSEGCGAEIPRWLKWRLQSLENDKESLKAFGLDVVTKLAERVLAGGAPGLHFYTLNQAELTLEIAQRLGFGKTEG